MPGKAEILVTGNLKRVMRESASVAMTFVRSRAARLGLDPEFLRTIDLHLHVPKGETPKDGPSAGVTMFSAVASLVLAAAVRKDVAMTGRDLAPRRSPGIKEKLLAAHRARIKQVLVPRRISRRCQGHPRGPEGAPLERIDEMLPIVLEPPLAGQRRTGSCRAGHRARRP
jgi:ATP-dependent Lon protease